MSEMEDNLDNNIESHWRKYSLDDFVQALESKGGEASTPEIRTEVGCSPETSRRRMKELADKGVVEQRKIGSTWVWQLTDR